MKVRYEIRGQECTPLKRENIYIEINHDQGAIINQVKPHVSVKNLFFAREDVLKIMSDLDNPPGITEGIPLDIIIEERGLSDVINMYIDVMDNFKRSREGIECSVKMLHSLDWLDDKFNSFTCESMYNEVGVPAFQIDGINYTSWQDYFDKRCIFIPYVLSSIPNFRDVFMAIFSITYITIELTKAIKHLTQWSAPLAGVGVVAGIAQLVLEVVFCIALIAAIIVLITQMFNALIQPVKYHGAMLIIDILKVISKKIGLNIQTSIFNTYPYNQLVYLPEKYNPLEEQNPASNTIFGITFGGFAKRGFSSPGYATGAVHDSSTVSIQKGYPNGMGGDFLRFAKTFCNGKFIIPDKQDILQLERRDYYPTTSTYQLPNIRQDWNGYNTDEMAATILLRFLDDQNDKNCIDKYVGTILQATHQQTIVIDERMVNLKGLRTVQIEAARGVIKESLNLIETIHQDLTTVFNTIVGTVAITAINAVILAINIVIGALNVIIAILNLMFIIINAIISVVNAIVNAISSLFGGSGVGTWSGITLIDWVPFQGFIPYQPLTIFNYTDRIGALLLENDMVTTPKVLMIDTARNEFNASGGYSGKKRIGYLHPDNAKVVNALKLWNDFYNIDAFVGSPNNRQTKISPATNHDPDKNPVLISLANFKELVYNPKFNDNFGEEIISETTQWYIEKNGSSFLEFRKQGWLKDPQNPDGIKRAQEININLNLKISVPNGQ